jgi:uncharacterized protein YjiS (DUF1127 family)
MRTRYGQLTVPHFIPSAKAPRSLAAKALRLPSQIYKRWLDEANIRQEIRDLEELDDHTLKDIGLQRGAIESHVRAGGESKGDAWLIDPS